MPSLRIVLVLLFSLAFTSLTSAQKVETKEPNFPTDEEILLVLTQAERAVGQYKPLLDMEEKLLGKEGAEAVAKDREVVHGIEVAIVSFRKKPQVFNSYLGFSFFEWLDDASRNALVAATNASNAVTMGLLSGNKEAATSSAELVKDFINASTALYTVSENAGALYTRYVQGEQSLAEEGMKIATECTNILKKSGAKKQ
jgi:hypothetical protein